MRYNYQTLQKLVRRVLERLSMYKGTSVQIYAEDRIKQMILDNYTLAFDSFDWSNLYHWNKFTLTGNNGEVLENVSEHITDFSDIVTMTPDSIYRRALRRLHSASVPDLVKGTIPCYYQIHATNPNKIFQVIPFTATGDVYVCSKGRFNTNPSTEVDVTTVIPFDSDFLVYATCMDYLADDSSSELQYKKFKEMRDERMRVLKVIDNTGTFDYNDSMAYYVTTVWR